MKIGVIGSGISGLACSFFLNQKGHDTTLIESAGRLGMEQFGEAVIDVQSGQEFYCDVPPRLFQSDYWPNLQDLYRQAGVQTVQADSGRSYSQLEKGCFLRLHQNLRPKMGPQLLSAKSRKILSEIQRLNQIAESHQVPASAPMGEFLSANQFSPEFVNQFLYPSLSSTVCTCDFSALDRYPAHVLIEGMFSLKQNSQLFRSKNGTFDVASKLAKSAKEILLKHQVRSMKPDGDQILVEFADQKPLAFDHVVLATEPSTSKSLIPDQYKKERHFLEQFCVQKVPVVVHTDPKLMPPQKSQWETFNMICKPKTQEAMCTIWLNRFYQWKGVKENIFQTILPITRPNLGSIIKEVEMNRATVTFESIAASNELVKIQEEDQERQVWFCGSFLTDQIPLLESGVRSAKKIASLIDKQGNVAA